MVNITQKSNSLRQAIATAILKVSSADTIKAIREKKVPKGDVFEFSRAAGLLAIKKTSDVIPDCHPLPIEYASITHEIKELNIIIRVEVHTIYKTGVEVEAMHGASISALTMYDMLKPIDKGIEISTIKLESKKGGKTDYAQKFTEEIKTAIIVCSDSIAAGKGEDKAGKMIMTKLEKANINTALYEIMPDDFLEIQSKAKQLSDAHFQLIVFCGGTGLSPRDVTPDAIKPLLTKEIPGIMDAARNYGQQRTPYAMLSRGIAGFINNSLVITLPGSLNGAAESMDAIFPYLLHVFQVAKGMRHE
jgi:cyclic pyranopterin monophosphate synthase